MPVTVDTTSEEHPSVERIIFLDIDGVLLPTRMWAAEQNVELLEAEPAIRASRIALDPGAIGLLVQLVQISGARLVLHSNWRRTWSDKERSLLEYLVRSGLPRQHWHPSWFVPTLEDRDKAREISSWLGEHGHLVRQCLILDDRPIEMIRASGSVSAAQVRPLIDDGFGMREYRSALKFFAVLDGRVRCEPAADLWPVSVQSPAEDAGSVTSV